MHTGVSPRYQCAAALTHRCCSHTPASDPHIRRLIQRVWGSGDPAECAQSIPNPRSRAVVLIARFCVPLDTQWLSKALQAGEDTRDFTRTRWYVMYNATTPCAAMQHANAMPLGVVVDETLLRHCLDTPSFSRVDAIRSSIAPLTPCGTCSPAIVSPSATAAPHLDSIQP